MKVGSGEAESTPQPSSLSSIAKVVADITDSLLAADCISPRLYRSTLSKLKHFSLPVLLHIYIHHGRHSGSHGDSRRQHGRRPASRVAPGISPSASSRQRSKDILRRNCSQKYRRLDHPGNQCARRGIRGGSARAIWRSWRHQEHSHELGSPDGLREGTDQPEPGRCLD